MKTWELDVTANVRFAGSLYRAFFSVFSLVVELHLVSGGSHIFLL
jgi:hypothetical protein